MSDCAEPAQCYVCEAPLRAAAEPSKHACKGGMDIGFDNGDCDKRFCAACAAGSRGLARCGSCGARVCRFQRQDDTDNASEHVMACGTCGATFCQECAYETGAMRWCDACTTQWCADKCARRQFTLGQEWDDTRCDACVRKGVPREQR